MRQSKALFEKQLIVVFCLSVVLLAGGCKIPKRIGSSSSSGSTDLVESGIQGLEMSFANNMPPSKIFGGDPESLKFVLEVQNKGLHSITKDDVIVKLGGYDRFIDIENDRFVQTTTEGDAEAVDGKTQFKFDLEGRRDMNPEGDKILLMWNTKEIDYPEKHDTVMQSFTATACYKYKTIAHETLCMDPKPTALVKEIICRPTVRSYRSGQGAPVGLVKLEQSIMPSKKNARVKLILQNLGKGTVFNIQYADEDKGVIPDYDEIKNDMLNICADGLLDIKHLNKVQVSAYVMKQVDGQSTRTEVECNPRDVVLYKNQGITYCTVDLADVEDPYVTPLVVEMQYGYTTRLIKQVELVTEGNV